MTDPTEYLWTFPQSLRATVDIWFGWRGPELRWWRGAETARIGREQVLLVLRELRVLTVTGPMFVLMELSECLTESY